jgi:hypothetical protein
MALEAMSTNSAVEAKVSRFGPREFVDVTATPKAGKAIHAQHWFDLVAHKAYSLDLVKNSCSWMTYTGPDMPPCTTRCHPPALRRRPCRIQQERRAPGERQRHCGQALGKYQRSGQDEHLGCGKWQLPRQGGDDLSGRTANVDAGSERTAFREAGYRAARAARQLHDPRAGRVDRHRDERSL